MTVIEEDMAYSQNHDLFEKEQSDGALTPSRKELFEKAAKAHKDDRQRLYSAMMEFAPNLHDIKSTIASSFVKKDDGKNMLSLIEPQFVVDLGKVLTFGAKKYAPNNWKLCEDTSRYKDALLRHLYAYLDGELVDPETGLDHLAHISCNVMFLQYFENKKKDSQ